MNPQLRIAFKHLLAWCYLLTPGNCYEYEFEFRQDFKTVEQNILKEHFPKRYTTSPKHLCEVSISTLIHPFAKQNCLIKFINYQSCEIYPLTYYPVILRDITLRFMKNSYGQIPILAWFTNKIAKITKLKFDLFETLQNLTSYTLIEPDSLKQKEFTPKTNQKSYILHSRLWNCEVDKGIYPPTLLWRPVIYRSTGFVQFQQPPLGIPEFWYHRPKSKHSAHNLEQPSYALNSVYKINILYIDTELNTDDITNWIEQTISSKQDKLHTTMNLFLSVFPKKYTFRLYKICLGCANAKNNIFVSISLPFTLWSTINKQNAFEEQHHDNTIRLYWNMVDKTSMQYRVVPSSFWGYGVTNSTLKWVTLAYIDVFKYLIGNHTYHPVSKYSDLPFSSNFMTYAYISTHLGIKITKYYPLVIADIGSSMRFISCEQRFHRNKLFENLRIEHFHEAIALGIFILTLTIAVISEKLFVKIKHIYLTGSSWRVSILFVLKYLSIRVEKVKSTNLYTHISTGLPITMVLLLGLRIYINISKTVMSSRRIPHKTFSELVNSNFSILSRFGGGESKCEELNHFQLVEDGPDFIRLIAERCLFFILSEVSIYLRGAEIRDQVDNGEKVITSFRDLATMSYVHPENMKYIPKLIETGWNYDILEPPREIYMAEEINLIQKLVECNMTAVALPLRVCWVYFNEICKRRKDVFIDVGRESVGNFFLTIHFSGVFLPYLQNRISVLPSTGILEWWAKENLNGSFMNTVNKVKIPKHINPSSFHYLCLNLSFGLALTTLIFVFERLVLRV